MNILTGIQNFLQMVNDNWTTIVVIVALLVSIYKKIMNLFGETDERKIAIAKQQIREIMLKRITDAECEYSEWVKSGSIKRAQVIEEIFVQYPILSKVIDQEEIIAWIDEVIDEALDTLRDIIEKQDITEVVSEV